MRFLAQTIKRKIEKEVIAVRAHSVKMTGVSSYLFIFSFEIRSSSKRIVRMHSDTLRDYISSLMTDQYYSFIIIYVFWELVSLIRE
jgi:tRNA(His) 5'-end guanylyltransferase